MLFVLGAFAPFALTLGGRRLGDVGYEIPWFAVLVWFLVVGTFGGAVVGALCGAASRVWHLKH